MMKFNHVAEVFDQIEQESSRTIITHHLAKLFGQATAHEAAIIAYMSLGSLNPPYIATQFQFAEKSLIKVLASLLDVTEQTVKAQAKVLGDVGLVAAQSSWSGGSDVLSLTDVQKMLLHFLTISGTGSQEIKEEKILKLLRALDPSCAKYIIRLLEGNLRLGFSDMTLLDAFSWMEAGDKSLKEVLENAYNMSADIGLIIKTLKEDGLAGIAKISITPGVPIRPSAAERMSDAASIVKKLGDCVAQLKLDGFRLQVHLDKTKPTPMIRFFSRNLVDMSSMFPDLVRALEHVDVQQLVVEGEAICVDQQTGSFLPFQETVKRKRKNDVDKFAQDFPLKLYLFDVLYLNGESMLDVDHAHRRRLMLQLCDHPEIKKEGVIIPIEEKAIHSGQQLSEYFQQSISMGLEGLVVKRTDARYQPGKRNFNWIKLKREESGSLDDTLDCVILGYYTGQGKRANFGIGALLVGIYNIERDCYQTIAKIGTGLTDDEWRAQKKACDALERKTMPHEVECAKELYPDVWVAPQLVCMIRADEITRSPMHKAGATETELGYALRFPRLMGYRPDKSATAATGVDEVKRLYQLQFEKRALQKN
jgi:DNA ligase 1